MGADLTRLPVFGPEYADCDRCELIGQCARGMSVTAYRPKDFNGVMIVGEGPGQQEVSQHRPFVGKSGLLLRSFLEGAGLDMDRCYITNATSCKPPPKNKALHEEFPNAIPACVGRLEKEIEAVQPKVIITLGAAAWIAISGRDEHKVKRVAFDCPHCDANRKVGPVLQCNASVPNPDDGGATSIPCHHAHFFSSFIESRDGVTVKTAVNPTELEAFKARGCVACGAKLKGVRPKMIKCLQCGGYKMREEPYTEFVWDYGISKIAGFVFEPAPDNRVAVDRKEYELDGWYGQQGVRYVVPTFHPSFLMRGQQYAAKPFNKHLIHAVRLLSGAQPAEVKYRVTADPAVVRAFIYGWEPNGDTVGVSEFDEVVQYPAGLNFAVDIETEAVIDGEAEDARKFRNVTSIKCIGISTTTETLVVDTRNVRPADPTDPLLQMLFEFLTDDRIAKTYHNGAGYDLPAIDLVWGIPWNEMISSYHDDTQYAHKNLYPDAPSHRLESVTSECVAVHAWKPVRVSNGAQVHKDFDELALYNARDTYHTALSREHMGVSFGRAIPGERMDRAGLSAIYAQDSKIRKIAIGMTMQGMPLNKAVFQKAGDIATKNVDDARESIRNALHEAGFQHADALNPDSGPQVIELLFGPNSFFKLTAIDQTEKGGPATSKVALLKVMATTQEKYALAVLNGLLTLRTQAYIARNYVFAEGMQPWQDGRLHPLWQPWGTKTGRMSSSPNCFDGETEVLTSDGWVRFDQIDPAVHKEIAQADDNGVITFVEPIGWVKKHFCGEMVYLKGRHTRLLVTPDHDCLVQRYNTDTKCFDLEVHKAAAYPRDCLQLHGGYFSAAREGEYANQLALDAKAIKTGVRFFRFEGNPEYIDVLQLQAVLTRRTATKLSATELEVGVIGSTGTNEVEKLYVPWNAPVYCVTVPTHHILVRREGRVCITNQCQNWPKWLRDAVEAAPGRKIVGADADQLELRNIAHLSGDAEMIRRVLTADGKRKLEPDHDPHSFVAQIAFGEGYTGLHLNDPKHTDKSAGGDKKLKCRCQTCQRFARRDLIKRVIYGLNYGAGAMTVLEAIYDGGYEGPPITIEMVEHVKRVVFQTFPAIPKFRDELLRNAKLSGEIRSPMLGRRRIFPLPEELGGNIPITEIYNYPIQTYAADYINEATIEFYEQLYDVDPTAFLMAQVHDALYAECNEDRAEDVAKLLLSTLTKTKTINGIVMEFTASAKVKQRWGAAA